MLSMHGSRGPIRGIKPSARLNSERIDPDATADLDRFQLPAPSPFVDQLFTAMRQKGGFLDDDIAIRRSRRSERAKVRDFSLEPRNLGVSIVERIVLV
jgi:hypothetical protein